MTGTVIKRRALSPVAMAGATGVAVVLADWTTRSQTVCAVLASVPAALGWATVLMLAWALPPHEPLSETRMLLAGIASMWLTVRAALALGVTAVYGASVAIAMNSYLGHHTTASSRAEGHTILVAMLEPTKYIGIALIGLTPMWLSIAMCRTSREARREASEKAVRILYLLPVRMLVGLVALMSLFFERPWTRSSKQPQFPHVEEAITRLIDRFTRPSAIGWLWGMTMFAVLLWLAHLSAGGVAAG